MCELFISSIFLRRFIPGKRLGVRSGYSAFRIIKFIIRVSTSSCREYLLFSCSTSPSRLWFSDFSSCISRRSFSCSNFICSKSVRSFSSSFVFIVLLPMRRLEGDLRFTNPSSSAWSCMNCGWWNSIGSCPGATVVRVMFVSFLNPYIFN